MDDFEECMKARLLLKTTPSIEKANATLAKAEEFLKEAKGNLRDGRYNSAALVAYAAMFDAGRALLFRDGYRERSHVCVIRYLEKKYAKVIPEEVIELFDRYRAARHEIQYGPILAPSETEARIMTEFAERFIGIARKLLKPL